MLGPFLWGKSDINQAYPLRLDLPIAAAPSVFSCGRPFPMLIACKRARSAIQWEMNNRVGLRKSFKSEYVIKGAIPRAVHFKFKRSVDIGYLLIASVSSIALYSYMPPCNVQ